MKTFESQFFANAYAMALASLDRSGDDNAARGLGTKEFLDTCIKFNDPTKCLYSNNVRGSQFKYVSAELIWYFMGMNDVEFISEYAKFWKTIDNGDGTVNSAYGYLLFVDSPQYKWAYDSLVADKNTRQAIMHFNQPKHQYKGNKDFVCTMYANFHIRDNKLHMRVNMRSNDAIWGTPTDVAFFAILQQQLHRHLLGTYPDLELGSYSHVADSFHVYERHYDLLTRMNDKLFVPQELVLDVDLVEPDGTPSEALMDFKRKRHDMSYTTDSKFLSTLFSWINMTPASV